MNATPPVALMLDSQAHARLHENGLLAWWLQNTSNVQLAEIRVDVSVAGLGNGLHVSPSKRENLPIGPARRLSTAFRANEPGHYALRVRVELHRQDSAVELWECPHEITLQVGHPDAQGQVHMTFNDPSLLKGQLQPGHYVFNAPAVVKPAGEALSAGGGQPSPLGLHGDLPPAERQLQLPLAPVAAPGLGPDLDLALFAQQWQVKRRPALAELNFVDERGKPRRGTARVNEPYRVQLQSYRCGHITLISQGTSGRYFQVSPHLHYGQQVARAGEAVLFPDQILRNLSPNAEGQTPDPKLDTKPLGLYFQNPGNEQLLAIISPTQIATPLAIYAGVGSPNQLRSAQVRLLLASLAVQPEVELGYTRIEVTG